MRLDQPFSQCGKLWAAQFALRVELVNQARHASLLLRAEALYFVDDLRSSHNKTLILLFLKAKFLEENKAQTTALSKQWGKDELKVIAAELVTRVRKSVTIDWTVRAVTDAKQRPGFQNTATPNLQDEATKTDSHLPIGSPFGFPSMSPAPATSIVLA